MINGSALASGPKDWGDRDSRTIHFWALTVNMFLGNLLPTLPLVFGGFPGELKSQRDPVPEFQLLLALLLET